jgi:drug/metabolite transporter (DMT)-like permease
MNSVNENKAIGYALITVLFWSTVATAFKIGLNTLDPANLIFFASVTSLLILFITLLISGKLKLLKELKTGTVLLSVLLGFMNPFLYYLVLFKSYSLLPAQVAQPINMVWPIILVLLSVPILKKKITWKSIVALFISFGGVFLISTQGDFFSIKKSDPTGIVLGLGSAFIWAVFWIFNLKNKEDHIVKLFLNFLFGTLFLLIYIPIFSKFNFEWNKSFVAAVYIGIFETGLSFMLWFKAISLTSNQARLANLVYLAPFLSLIFIRFILKEQIHLSTVIGIFFIISGILFQQTDKAIKNEQ